MVQLKMLIFGVSIFGLKFKLFFEPELIYLSKISILAEKLNVEVDNVITFYVDKRIKNDFMSIAVDDVRCTTNKTIDTTDKQVN